MLGSFAAPIALASCQSALQKEPRTDAASKKIFFPPAPDVPRIQHLTTFSGEADLVPKTDTGFASFVLGDKSHADKLVQPYGCAMHDGKLYVVDTGGARLVRFDLVAQHYDVLRGSGAGVFQRPINITIDSDGTKYVCDAGRKRMMVLDADDNFIASFGQRHGIKPVDCAVVGDVLHVVDISAHRVVTLDKHDGRLINSFGRPGSKPGEMFHPTNIDVGPDGDLFIVETSNFRVQRFTPTGEHRRLYGAIGDGPGKFARPKGLAIDRVGRIFVGDSAFENVQVFNPDGQLLMYFGSNQTPPLRLNLPAGISIDYDNVKLFERYADTDFQVEYLIMVASQFGPNKVDVFGFGKKVGAYNSLATAQLATTVPNHVV
jgi:sugar lactone lactonase YvrE